MTRALAIVMAVAAATVLAAFLMSSSSVVAQQRMPCAPRDVVVESLTGPEHKERVVLRGLVAEQMLEVYLNDSEGTYTIILTRPADNLSCMVATGSGMHYTSDKPKSKSKL